VRSRMASDVDVPSVRWESQCVFSHMPIEFGQTGISAIWSADPENPGTKHGVNRMIRRGDIAIWIFQDGGSRPPSRHLGCGETGNSAIRSADLENPTVEPNMKWIGWPLAEIWPFEFSQMWGRWSSAGPQYILLLTLISYTPLRYVRNVAREE